MPDAEDDQRVARRLVIRGLVQGVSYRAAAAAEANRLALSGWVRNRRDGAVEALVCGRPAAVDAFLGWARRGPPAARVSGVDAEHAELPPETSFRIRHDG